MKKILLAAVLMSSAIYSCSDFKVTTTPEGDRIQFHEKNDGTKPQDGDMLTIDMVIKDANDTTYRNTFDEGEPLVVDARKGVFKGSFENALYQLSEGDSATVFVSADSMFARMQQPLPGGLAKGSDLKFTVVMRKIMTQAQYADSIKEKMAKEGEVIKSYVDENLAGAIPLDDTGIYYKITTNGSGSTPERGNRVSLNYLGKLMNGKVFDQTREGAAPFEFQVGMGFVIPGWDAMVLKMKKGDKLTCVIPSALGYGEQGAGGAIPPFSPLVFDMELLDIKK